MRPRLVLAMLVTVATTPARAAWHFTDVTAEAGLTLQHGYAAGAPFSEPAENAGGVASGDYDGDGWTDLYVVRGEIGPNVLFRNRGDGTFDEVGAAAGVALTGVRSSGPLFADLDGDGRVDLLVGGVDGTPVSLFHNVGDGTFDDVTAASGLVIPADRDTFGATAADYDRDGDLDLFLAHWQSSYFEVADTSSYHLWLNDGGGTFTDVTLAAGIRPRFPGDHFASFTGNFVDVDGDGWLDLLVAADFGTSRVYHNAGDGTFVDVTDADVITDGNGMGAAIGDYDEDGDFDWFVSSIWDPNGIAEGFWDTSGNRLYRNRGDGTFEDATDAAGVRYGYWGWGSTFEDLDDDGHLDLFHVNGFGSAAFPETAEFTADPARLFVGNGDGTLTERALELGVADTGKGRGVVAFDYDRDGDLDLFVANTEGMAHLYRNDGLAAGRSVTVRLRGAGANSEAIGARLDAVVGAKTLPRLIRAGSNYVSQDPAEAHLGLGASPRVDALTVRWPDGSSTEVGPVPAGARITVTRAEESGCGTGSTTNDCRPGRGTRKNRCLFEWRGPGLARARGGAKIVCRRGDPACDLEPDPAAARCRVPIAPCIDVADPRVPRCTPEPIASLEFPAPTDPAVAASLRAAGRASGLPCPEPGSESLFANATPSLCADAMPLTVPLRQTSSGRFRRGTLRITARVEAVSGRVDRDPLVVVCLP